MTPFFFHKTKDNMLVIIHANLESIPVVVGILGREAPYRGPSVREKKRPGVKVETPHAQ